MNDTDFDPDNDDATLEKDLKLLNGVTYFDLFNHSYSFTALQLSPMTYEASTKSTSAPQSQKWTLADSGGSEANADTSAK